MAQTRATFRGLNTDEYPARTPSGTASRAHNVELSNGTVKRRKGFALVEDDITGAGGAPLGMWTAQFGDGDVYLIVKCATGSATKLWQRKMYDAGGVALPTSFTEIASGQTHNSADVGWAFMWADRFHYFDRVGGTRWNPDVNSGNAYKAGLCKPSTGPLVAAAAGAAAAKDGLYHVVIAHQNSVTGEMSVVCGPGSPPVECDLYGGTGGIATTNWLSTLRTQDSSYEWDQDIFYCTTGNSEHVDSGDGTYVEVFSHRYYPDVVMAKSQSTLEVGLNRPDHVLDPYLVNRNAGGEPPGAQLGVLAGSQAVYGRVYVSSTLQANRIDFSLPTFPTMVPKEVSYSAGGDTRTIHPQPWTGRLVSGVVGNMNAMAGGGDLIVAFTPTTTTILDKGGDGRIWPRVVHPGWGCVAQKACVHTSFGVFALAYETFVLVNARAVQDLSKQRITTTLQAIPAAYRTSSVLGWFSTRSEVWAAVAGVGKTFADTLLIYDHATSEYRTYSLPCVNTRATLTYAYDPAESILFTAETPGTYPAVRITIATGGTKGAETVSVSGADITVTVDASSVTVGGVTTYTGTTGAEFIAAFNKCAEAVALCTVSQATGAGTACFKVAMSQTALTGGTGTEGIAALCEMALPNAAPVMLVATTGGKIFSYPGTNDTDTNSASAAVNFAAEWRGYFGQERSPLDQHLQRVAVHTGSNAASNVRVSCRAVMNPGQTDINQLASILEYSNAVNGCGVEFALREGHLFELQFFTPQSVASQWEVKDMVLDVT